MSFLFLGISLKWFVVKPSFKELCDCSQRKRFEIGVENNKIETSLCNNRGFYIFVYGLDVEADVDFWNMTKY